MNKDNYKERKQRKDPTHLTFIGKKTNGGSEEIEGPSQLQKATQRAKMWENKLISLEKK